MTPDCKRLNSFSSSTAKALVDKELVNRDEMNPTDPVKLFVDKEEIVARVAAKFVVERVEKNPMFPAKLLVDREFVLNVEANPPAAAAKFTVDNVETKTEFAERFTVDKVDTEPVFAARIPVERLFA